MPSDFLKPLGIGRLLDRSFQLYRNHFSKFFLLMLMFYAPFGLLQALFQQGGLSMPVLPSVPKEWSWEEFAENSIANPQWDESNVALLFVYILIVLPVYICLLLPVSTGAVTVIVRGSMQGEEVTLRTALRQAWRRWGRLLGSTIVFMMAMYGLYIVTVVVFVVLIFIFGLGFGGMTALMENNTSMTVLGIIGMAVLFVLFLAVVIAGFGFSIIRFGFYLPHALLEDRGLGLKASWHLTRGHFWRILGGSFVLGTIYYVVSLLVGLMWVIGGSVITTLLGMVLNMVLLPILMTWYVVSYFDLKIRNEGYDLRRMLQQREEQVAAHES
ncbi:DUF7544 domain-containing protein [Paenibacillus sp. y28]|uniref:DUF7544 domain-containing protein n=1 Tax=Paenibacillus sp. y28 TaxID=3129110 RepID=UPI00301987B0